MHYSNRGLGVSPPAFQGQALAFGKARNQDLLMLRVGIIGCGGTGSAIAQSAVPSAIAMLLPKMGIRNIALFDKDVVRQLLIWLRFIRQPDLSARIVPTHPAPENIKPGEILVVGDAEYQKWACFRCPGGCGESMHAVLESKAASMLGRSPLIRWDDQHFILLLDSLTNATATFGYVRELLNGALIQVRNEPYGLV